MINVKCSEKDVKCGQHDSRYSGRIGRLAALQHDGKGKLTDEASDGEAHGLTSIEDRENRRKYADVLIRPMV